MKCPLHKVEMRKIDETVNENDGTYVFWICDGEGRFPRKHIIRTEDWAGNLVFYEPFWRMVKW